MKLICADSLVAMGQLPANSVDTIITDPPYGLKFMGKEWDHGIPGRPFWAEALRVAKPGAMLMAFGGTRTYHRLVCEIEDAGWQIRDTIMWVYGEGFPKSLDISKAIDKAAGIEREDKFEGSFDRRNGPTGNKKCDKCGHWLISSSPCQCPRPQDAAISEDAKTWQGYGTALKPSWEPITLAMKPLDGTFEENARKWGVAGLWIDGGRVEGPKGTGNWTGSNANASPAFNNSQGNAEHRGEQHPKGRWPANVIHDGSPEVVEGFPEEAGAVAPVMRRNGDQTRNAYGSFAGSVDGGRTFQNDEGSASRFFYCAKPSKEEREEGLRQLPAREAGIKNASGRGYSERNPYGKVKVRNHHPTVKPIELLRYLCKLTRTPKGGIVLDPFMGSGSTGCAAVMEGRDFIGIDISREYVEIAERRIAWWFEKGSQLTIQEAIT